MTLSYEESLWRQLEISDLRLCFADCRATGLWQLEIRGQSMGQLLAQLQCVPGPQALLLDLL
jgi:hypothetical protein